MKILMINDNDPDEVVGGSEHYIADLTRALDEAGHEIHWFVLGSDIAPDIGASVPPLKCDDVALSSLKTTRRAAKCRFLRRHVLQLRASCRLRQADRSVKVIPRRYARSRKRVFRPGPSKRWASILRRVAFYTDLNRDLADCLARVQPDVVHLHNNHRYPFTILAATRGHRVVQTVHDYCAIYPTAYCSRERSCAGRSVFAALRHGCMTWKLLATEACLLYGRRYLDRRFVKAFIAPSRNLATHLERMGLTNVFHVPNLRWLPRAESTPVPDGQVVLYVGGLIEHKGVDILLAAFARLAGDLPQAALWLVGDGPEADDLKASTAEYSPCQVRFLGERSPDELAEIYRQARVVVLPSLWLENAPLVAIEASAHGRAVVASRVGGLPELVEDGRTGFLFDRRDIAGLAERLRLLLTDRGLAGELGAAGHERLAPLRSPGQHLESLLAVYDRARH